MESLSKLEQTTALRILWYLYKTGKSWFGKLQIEIGGSPETFYRAIDRLVELELIERGEKEKGRGGKTWFLITNKGRRAGEKIDELVKILEANETNIKS